MVRKVGVNKDENQGCGLEKKGALFESVRMSRSNTLRKWYFYDYHRSQRFFLLLLLWLFLLSFGNSIFTDAKEDAGRQI